MKKFDMGLENLVEFSIKSFGFAFSGEDKEMTIMIMTKTKRKKGEINERQVESVFGSHVVCDL